MLLLSPTVKIRENSVTCHLSPFNCPLSHVTNGNSHIHRPSPLLTPPLCSVYTVGCFTNN